MKCTRWIWSK